jgi:hypothetical protein
MSDSATIGTKVTIGGKEYTIQRFRGLKAILVMASITRIGRDVPDILADAAKEYYGRNKITVTEPMSKLERWQGFSAEDFDRAEKSTGKREIELPAPITAREQVMTALPALLEHARTEVIRLFAILVVPNEELMIADKADNVNEVLDKYNDLFLYEAEVDELVDVALAAQETIMQLEDSKRERLGKLLRGLTDSMGWTQASQTPVLPSTPTEEAPTSTSPTSTPDAQTLFTDSQAPTDGAESSPSLVSPGVS